MLIGSLHLRFEQLVNAAKPIDHSWYKKRNVSFRRYSVSQWSIKKNLENSKQFFCLRKTFNIKCREQTSPKSSCFLFTSTAEHLQQQYTERKRKTKIERKISKFLKRSKVKTNSCSQKQLKGSITWTGKCKCYCRGKHTQYKQTKNSQFSTEGVPNIHVAPPFHRCCLPQHLLTMLNSLVNLVRCLYASDHQS